MDRASFTIQSVQQQHKDLQKQGTDCGKCIAPLCNGHMKVSKALLHLSTSGWGPVPGWAARPFCMKAACKFDPQDLQSSITCQHS
jgi:hypothetical protein